MIKAKGKRQSTKAKAQMVMMIMMMVPIHTKMFLRFESLLRSSLIENNPWVDCVGGFRGWIPLVDSVGGF